MSECTVSMSLYKKCPSSRVYNGFLDTCRLVNETISYSNSLGMIGYKRHSKYFTVYMFFYLCKFWVLCAK